MKRKGMGAGRGKGYKNLIPKDKRVHKDSGNGIKQPQKIKEIMFRIDRKQQQRELIENLLKKKEEENKKQPQNISNSPQLENEYKNLLNRDIDDFSIGIENIKIKRRMREIEQELAEKEIENKLEPFIDFLQVDLNSEEKTAKVSLKKNISFKEFNQYFPEISKKELVKLFDKLDDDQKRTYRVIKKLTSFARDNEGKISATELSAYGKQQLSSLDGALLHFTDITGLVKGNKLVDENTGEVISKIDNDRFVNKIMFKVLM